jgi:D-serine deaminase-like pyridoxal phosphate-dependent protein
MLGHEMHSITLADLETPCLLLDAVQMKRNVARLRSRLHSLGVPLRPHLKTVKSPDVARFVLEKLTGPAAVSTLKEAEQFGEAGVRDILYAVGATPNKLDRIAAIRGRGIDLSIIVDSVAAAEAVGAKSRETKTPIPTLVEIDCDGHRAGVADNDFKQLIAVGSALHRGGAQLRGIMTHAGASYSCVGTAALEAMAEQERASAVACADTLRQAGLPAPIVSVGSTPTAFFARNLQGVTEMRAGVFPFFDLFMTGVGVCGRDEIAISVLTTVLGHQRNKGHILVDAGWMAMSRDRGTAKQKVDQGYGLASDLTGRPYEDLVMVDAHQEQGVLAIRAGSNAKLPDLSVGDLVRILPNHACATGAQHEVYHVVHSGSDQVHARWPRFRGW